MSKATCSVEGCERSGKLTRGWCNKHYLRWWKHGTVDDPERQGCSINGCDRRHKGHGLCETHLARLKRNGTTRLRTDEERFWSHVDRSGGPDACWLWTSYIVERLGYPYFAVGGRNGKNMRANRYVYELYKGPIPEGLVVDHVCNVRHCVNPGHLQAITQRENVLRQERVRA